MAGRQTATVKILHRATDEPSSDGDSPNGFSDVDPQRQLQTMKAENESLKQRLEQAKATSASERKRLADELKLERAGRERAEELLVKQAKELEAITAAKGRLEEAFGRSMAELRSARQDYSQANQTIQQLLRELMLLREIVRVLSSGGSQPSNGAADGANKSNGATSTAHAGAAQLSHKRISRSKLLGELQQLRQAKAAAESNRDSLLQKLDELVAEKERAEESQEMISRQTAKLLDDKRKLLTDLGSKDEAVRGLEAGLDHLQHQLQLALDDRQLLLEELSKVADKGELEALQTVLQEGDSSSYLQDSGDEEQQLTEQYSEEQHQLLLQELEALQMEQQHLQQQVEGHQPVVA